MVLLLKWNEEQEQVSNIHRKKKHFESISVKKTEQYNNHMEVLPNLITECH